MVPEIALRDAVMARLQAATALAALVGGKVFDIVPSDDEAAELPWICMGPIRAAPLDMGCSSAWQVSMKILVESADFNRVSNWTIARAAIRVLDKAVLPEEAGFRDELKVTGAGDVNEPGEIKTVWVDVSTVMVDVD